MQHFASRSASELNIYACFYGCSILTLYIQARIDPVALPPTPELTSFLKTVHNDLLRLSDVHSSQRDEREPRELQVCSNVL